jgi:hypothetical protein
MAVVAGGVAVKVGVKSGLENMRQVTTQPREKILLLHHHDFLGNTIFLAIVLF